MLIVKIGGPAYRIGMGGGAASSVPSGSREGGNAADLDFNAVQVRQSFGYISAHSMATTLLLTILWLPSALRSVHCCVAVSRN